MNSTASIAAQAKTASFLERANIIRRYIEPQLSHAQRAVLAFATDRTYGWSKEWERTSINQMVEGVWIRKTGECVHLGAGVAPRSIASALQWLVEQGFLLRRVSDQHAGAYEYSINWKHIMSLLPKPRKPKEKTTAKDAVPHCNDCSKTTAKSAVHKKERQKGKHKNEMLRASHAAAQAGDVNKEVSDGPETLKERMDDRIAQGAGRSRRARQQRLKKSKRLTSTVMEAYWREFMAECWEGLRIVPWSPKERGSANNFVKYVGDDAPKIMEWCIRNWHIVGKSKFPAKRGVDFPANPDFGFMFAYRKAFLEIYNDREFREKIAGDKLAGLIVTLRKMGYSEEAAMAEVEERRKRDDWVADLEDWEQELKRKAKVLNAQPLYGNRVNPGANKGAEERVRAKANERAERKRMVPEDELPDMEEMKARAAKIKRWE